MSDWLASNESYFPLIDVDEEEVKDETTRHCLAWEKWWKGDIWNPDYCAFSDLYLKRFKFNTIREVQEKFSEIIDKTNNPGIFILEAPMGVGKTEASLIAVEQLANKCNKSGLFFALPTQATSNGIFPRIKSWLEKLADDNFDNYSIRLSHGKAALNEDFISIKGG